MLTSKISDRSRGLFASSVRIAACFRRSFTNKTGQRTRHAGVSKQIRMGGAGNERWTERWFSVPTILTKVTCRERQIGPLVPPFSNPIADGSRAEVADRSVVHQPPR